MTSASVVVCTRDRPDLLAQSLPTVLATGAHVIVVEQGDSGARRFAADVRLVRDDGHGASRARNLGLAAAVTDVVLFTDDDCAVAPSWADEHLAAYADPDVVMTLGPVDGLSQGAGIADHLRRARPWLLGHSANMGVRRSEALRAGGFDPRLGAGVWARGGEDADLISRLLATGLAVVPDVGPTTTHLDWRTDEQTRANARGYERGAGAWLGRAARRRDPNLRRYAAARLGYRRERTADELHDGQLADAVAEIGQFAIGLAYGLVVGR